MHHNPRRIRQWFLGTGDLAGFWRGTGAGLASRFQQWQVGWRTPVVSWLSLGYCVCSHILTHITVERLIIQSFHMEESKFSCCKPPPSLITGHVNLPWDRMGSQLHCQPWRRITWWPRGNCHGALTSSLDFSSVTNKPTYQLSKAGQEECDWRIIFTFSEGLCRPLKHKVKLSILFQLASKEGGTQEGPEDTGLSVQWSLPRISWRTQMKSQVCIARDLFFQIEIIRWGEKLCFQKQGTLWTPIVNQTFLHPWWYPWYKISAWPVAL